MRVTPLLRIGSAILAVIVLFAIVNAFQPTSTAATTQPAGATTLPRIINQTGTTLPLSELAKSKPPTTMLSFAFHNTPIDTALASLSKRSGLIFVVWAPADMQISWIAVSPVSSDDLAALLDDALEPDVYSTLQGGRVVKIYSRADSIEEIDSPPLLGLFVRHLTNADAQATALRIAAMYADSNSVIASADERSNNVVVSGPPDVLDAIKQWLDQLDPAPTTAPAHTGGAQ